MMSVFLDEIEYKQAILEYVEQMDEEIANCQRAKSRTTAKTSCRFKQERRDGAAKALQIRCQDFFAYQTATHSYAIGIIRKLYIEKPSGYPYALVDLYTQERDYRKSRESVEAQYMQKASKDDLSSWLKDISRVIKENLELKGEYAWTWINNDWDWINDLRCWIFVLESARDSHWQRQCWGNSKSWAFVIVTNIAERFSISDSLEYQSTQMCSHLNGGKLAVQKSSQRLLPASRFPWPPKGWEVVIAEIVFRQSSKQYWPCSQHLLLLKMFQAYCPALLGQEKIEDRISSGSCKSFSRAGTMLNGISYQAPYLARPSLEKDWCWLPAPSALSQRPSSQHNPPGLSRLEGRLRKYLVLEKGECLNPTFLEDCYNIPPGWTDLSVQDPAIALIDDAGLRWEMLSIGGLPLSLSKGSFTSIPLERNNKSKSGLSISFGYTCDRLLTGQKTVTRRKWKERYAKMFIKAYQEGKQIRAIDKDFRYGGKIVGWLTLTQEPRSGWTHELTQDDCIKEGYPELSPAQFRDKFFKSPKDETMHVWILEFKFEPIPREQREEKQTPLSLRDLPLFEFAKPGITAASHEDETIDDALSTFTAGECSLTAENLSGGKITVVNNANSEGEKNDLSIARAKITRPAARWYGGKWILGKWIVEHLPSHKTYVEPFSGMWSVGLQKSPSETEVYNDLHPGAVNFWLQLRDHSQELIELIESTKFSKELMQWASAEDEGSPLERALKFYTQGLLSYTGGGVKWPGSSSIRLQQSGTQKHEHLWAIAERVKNVQIFHENAFDIIKRFDGPDTLFYCDPCYLPSERKSSQCYVYDMTTEQHEQLAELLNNVQGTVVLSGYPSELYEHLYQGWQQIEKETACNTSHQKTIECLWIKPKGPNTVSPVPTESRLQNYVEQLALDLGFSEEHEDPDEQWDGDCWRTPNTPQQPILDLVREALGGTIGLDPTADNQCKVPAQRHFTLADNCLIHNWISPARTVFMNMPYSNPVPFLEKLVEQINCGHVSEAIVLMPSSCLQGIACSEVIEKIAIGTCMWTKSRIAFLDKNGVPKKGANFGCSLVYFGNNWERFASVFRPWGWIFRSEAKEPAVLSVEVLPPVDEHSHGGTEQYPTEWTATERTLTWADMDLAEPSESTNLTESWAITDLQWQGNWPKNSHLTDNYAVNVIIQPSQILRDAVDVTAIPVEDENYAEPHNAATPCNAPTQDVPAEIQFTSDEFHYPQHQQEELTQTKGSSSQDIAFVHSSSSTNDSIIHAVTGSRKKRHAFPDRGSGCLQKRIANASRSRGGNPYWIYRCTYIDKETGKQKKRTRYVSKSKYSRVHAMIEERCSCYDILKYLGPPKKKSQKSA